MIVCAASDHVRRGVDASAPVYRVLRRLRGLPELIDQAVLDIAARFDNPVEACHAVVARAYELWIEREGRSDDITIICIFLMISTSATSTC